MLLSTAAWFHDLGYIVRHTDNEVIAVQMVRQTLPALGYSDAQLQIVCDIIMATHLPQSPHNRLEEIMADADLTALGSEDFLTKMYALRDEFASFGMVYTDEDWFIEQLTFMRKHQYFTESARKLRGAQKLQNIAVVESLLAESQKR